MLPMHSNVFNTFIDEIVLNSNFQYFAGVADELITFQYFVLKDGVELPRQQQIQKVQKGDCILIFNCTHQVSPQKNC